MIITNFKFYRLLKNIFFSFKGEAGRAGQTGETGFPGSTVSDCFEQHNSLINFNYYFFCIYLSALYTSEFCSSYVTKGYIISQEILFM